MNINSLIESLSSFKQDVPGEVAILELRRSSVDELQRRLRKLLGKGGEACGRNFDRGSWTTYEDRTLVKLPRGALAVTYHASGAFKLSAGLAPMESLFKELEPKSQLIERAQRFIDSLGFSEYLGRGEKLAFERLWQIKASAADRTGKSVEPVLCRAVGAFRHFVEGIPVLGPASVAVQVAAEGALDSVSALLRNPAAEVLEKAKTIHPERALRQIGQQLEARFGNAQSEVRLESREGLRFGYLSLPKRKSQRLLAPVYLVTVDIEHEQERQALVLALPATEKHYLPLEAPGSESLVGQSNKIATRRCCC